MVYNRNKPYNGLPLLPPRVELDTKSILKKTASAGRRLGELTGLSNVIPNPAILINTLTLQEARASSEIENILTTSDELFVAFSAKTNQIDSQTKEVLRYREALWHGYKTLKTRPVISTNLFVTIYQTIKQTTAGIRNTPGTKIIDHKGDVIYTPPEGKTVLQEKLKNLEAFIHQEDEIDILVKCAIMHYQFESIHPFTDGNGRTGRILNVLFLVYCGYLDLPILYLSEFIIRNKRQYYTLLRGVTENDDWENWILYFLNAIETTALSTKEKIIAIKNLFDETLEITKLKLPSYMYSKELVEVIFEQPYCKTQFLVERGIGKRQRASVYLKELEKIGLLKKKKAGRENLFLNMKLYDLIVQL